VIEKASVAQPDLERLLYREVIFFGGPWAGPGSDPEQRGFRDARSWYVRSHALVFKHREAAG
jgi:hypothetical protein